jgi:hypothetical protein
VQKLENTFVHIYNVNLELNKTYSTTMHKFIMRTKTINHLNIFIAKNQIEIHLMIYFKKPNGKFS